MGVWGGPSPLKHCPINTGEESESVCSLRGVKQIFHCSSYLSRWFEKKGFSSRNNWPTRKNFYSRKPRIDYSPLSNPLSVLFSSPDKQTLKLESLKCFLVDSSLHNVLCFISYSLHCTPNCLCYSCKLSVNFPRGTVSAFWPKQL